MHPEVRDSPPRKKDTFEGSVERYYRKLFKCESYSSLPTALLLNSSDSEIPDGDNSSARATVRLSQGVSNIPELHSDGVKDQNSFSDPGPFLPDLPVDTEGSSSTGTASEELMKHPGDTESFIILVRAPVLF